MSHYTQTFVLGYHGCDRKTAEILLGPQSNFQQSAQPYDWLGSGMYFWEADPERALEFANEQKARKRYQEPTVVGAVIDLKNCLNLSSAVGRGLLRSAFYSLQKFQETLEQAMPVNSDPNMQAGNDRVLRKLDNAVIQHLHQMIEDAIKNEKQLTKFDTVKSLFLEGDEVYPGAGFKEKSHIQLAVINPACIVGYFRPRLV